MINTLTQLAEYSDETHFSRQSSDGTIYYYILCIPYDEWL